MTETVTDATFWPTEIRLKKDEKILLSRITGFIDSPPDFGCAQIHLHSQSLQGIMIDGKGPFADPNPTGCGYGGLTTAPIG